MIYKKLPITPFEVTGFFNKAYMRVGSVEKRVSGFVSTEKYSLNPHSFNDEDVIVASESFSIKEYSAS